MLVGLVDSFAALEDHVLSLVWEGYSSHDSSGEGECASPVLRIAPGDGTRQLSGRAELRHMNEAAPSPPTLKTSASIQQTLPKRSMNSAEGAYKEAAGQTAAVRTRIPAAVHAECCCPRGTSSSCRRLCLSEDSASRGGPGGTTILKRLLSHVSGHGLVSSIMMRCC